MNSYKIYIRLFHLLTIICFVSCSKDIDYQIEEEDSILHQESEYIIVLGDLQVYTSQASNLPYYKSTMDWIRSQLQYGKSFDCILQVGDITDYNSTTHWQRFYDSTFTVAEKIPYITCTGNHDYAWDENGRIYDRSSTLINSYATFSSTCQNIVACYEEGKIENIVVSNEVFGERYDILVLEFGPRKEVVKWANDYVSACRDRKFILMTHEFLTRNGERISSGSYAEWQIQKSSWSSPENIWQKLIKDNDNIVCVVCGHNGFSTQNYIPPIR